MVDPGTFSVFPHRHLLGIEQHALRIASTVPNIYFPPERNSKAARNRASDRTMVIAG